MLLSSSVPCPTSTCKCLLERATVLQEVEIQKKKKKQIRQLCNKMTENPSMCPCQCDSGAGLALHTQWEDGESPG